MYVLYKEVDFYKYCSTCKYEQTPCEDDPCDECLSNPYNINSHKPVKWQPHGYKKGGVNKA